ncbi:MAG: hypothetical protein ACREOF_04680, partial [Gemmatimonadales bacterium]
MQTATVEFRDAVVAQALAIRMGLALHRFVPRRLDRLIRRARSRAHALAAPLRKERARRRELRHHRTAGRALAAARGETDHL